MAKLPTLLAIATLATLLTGCGSPSDAVQNSGDQPDTTDTQPSELPQPQDGFQPLQVNMVAQSGTYFPDGVEGIEFGCSDTLVTISTVPVKAESTDELVTAAMEFLLQDTQYYHGSPAVTNSLPLSETLDLRDVDVQLSAVNIALDGDLITHGSCEAHRIQAQLYGTATLAAQSSDVSITVNDTELNDLLGLAPFDTSALLEN